MKDFTSIIEKIVDKKDFVLFVETLTQDFKGNPESWENNRLDLYLEGISSWTGDMEGYYENNNIDITKLNQWQIFANILVAASIYEQMSEGKSNYKFKINQNVMFLLKANIHLSDENRKQEIKGNNYRPLLSFSNTLIRSGLIDLEEKLSLEMNKPYDNVLFKVYFYEDLDVENEFFIGREFKILEGSTFIGSGIISEIIGVT